MRGALMNEGYLALSAGIYHGLRLGEMSVLSLPRYI